VTFECQIKSPVQQFSGFVPIVAQVVYSHRDKWKVPDKNGPRRDKRAAGFDGLNWSRTGTAGVEGSGTLT
jgi:hypothetical protein